MSTNQPTEADFLRDVATHAMMIVIDDDDEFRHIAFKIPGTSSYSFQITTWPGYLAITGDMGSWLFTRLRDMFKFFRRDLDSREELPINRSYWAEKLVATSSNGRHSNGAEQYDPAKFRSAIYCWALRLCREAAYRGLDKKDRAELIYDIKELRDAGLEGEGVAHRAVADFRFYHNKLRHPLAIPDFWENNLRDWTYHYTWCCYAIVWAIKQYDAAKATAQESSEVNT